MSPATAFEPSNSLKASGPNRNAGAHIPRQRTADGTHTKRPEAPTLGNVPSGARDQCAELECYRTGATTGRNGVDTTPETVASLENEVAQLTAVIEQYERELGDT